MLRALPAGQRPLGGAMRDPFLRSLAAGLIAGVLLALPAVGATGMLTAGARPAQAAAWSNVRPMSTARTGAGTVRLNDGRLLVIGGTGASGNALASAEIFDPQTETWTSTANTALARSNTSSFVLPNGRVLRFGGSNAAGAPVSVAELYDPNANTWTTTASMAVPRLNAMSVPLPNGKVLAAGGQMTSSSSSATASAELDQPDIGLWTTTGSLALPRRSASATLLPTGKVLVAGGIDATGAPLGSAELYDPTVGLWSSAGTIQARTDGISLLLPNGRVLRATGGSSHAGSSGALATAEVYDPLTGAWSSAGALTAARAAPSGTLLNLGGRVLLFNGASVAGFAPSSEVYSEGAAPSYRTLVPTSLRNVEAQ